MFPLVARYFRSGYDPCLAHQSGFQNALFRLKLQRLMADADPLLGLFQCQHLIIPDLHVRIVRDAADAIRAALFGVA